ncbi:MAG TPA: ATP-grasp domain-containing protein [Clostridia bacterium]|nr:ATP-grasp domain-containing protein [Clostridia bacterium]
MNNKNLLILSFARHREFALKTLLRKGIRILTIDNVFNSKVEVADYVYYINNRRDSSEMFQAAVDFYKKRKFDGVFSFLDSSTITLGMLSDYFELSYFSESVGRILSDKYEVRKFLQKIGANRLLFFSVKSEAELYKAAETIGFPFVLKPRCRSAGEGVVVINNKQEMLSSYKQVLQAAKSQDLIAEEYICGDEYCAETLIYNGEVYVLAVTKKYVTHDRYCIEYIELTPAPIQTNLWNKISDFVRHTISEFGIQNAVLHIELKVNQSDEVRLIEINPRPAGNNIIESIYKTKQLNLYDYAYDIALKKPIDVNKLKQQMDKPFIRYALTYDFLNPTCEGKIKEISGIRDAISMLEHDCEKLTLKYKVGDLLPLPKSNNEVRGSIYLVDKDYHRIIKRSEEIENVLHFELE